LEVHRLDAEVAVAAAPVWPAGAVAAGPERFTDAIEVSDTIDCVQFNPAWTLHDDFVDTLEIQGSVWSDANGNPVREVDHVYHVSSDVNSVTGFTLHEHNHLTVTFDLVAGTATVNGAINIMQRRGVGEVIQRTGHKVVDAETGELITDRGPDRADDADFCAAVAP
jgi:hypothetical protein